MIESEKHALNIKIKEFCNFKRLPDVTLAWRNIPFSGEWGIAAPLFPLAAKEDRTSIRIPVSKRAEELAQELADFIGIPEGIMRVQAVKGYLNLYFSTTDHAKNVIDQVALQRMDYGKAESSNLTTMIEYSQPNTHKSMHVGHLRNVILGGAVSNILEAAGDKVIRANYIGDIGLHVIKWLWNYVKYHQGEEPGEDKTRWMGDLYAEADRRFSDDPEFEVEVRQYFNRWDAQDPEIVSLWKKTRQWSLEGFYQIYALLGEKFDRIYFESEVEESGKVFVEDLIKQGLATDGRPEEPVFINLDEKLGTQEEFRVAIVLRSDGTSLYATKELPLAVLKFKEFDLDRSIYVIDVRQSLHMKQILKILELSGYKWAINIEHLAYEIVNLPGNVTMSSRDGTVVLLDDLIKESTQRALEVVRQKNPELAEEKKETIALAVAIGAIKYPMLSRENTKIVTFDWDSALDFNGQSAPYIQYAHVRAGSIIRKAGELVQKTVRFNDNLEQSEVNLIETISRLPDEVLKSAKELKPSYIATYAYDLAKHFNEFYNACPVLSAEAEVKTYRLALVQAAKQCLANSLRLLGIAAPEVM
ncbi:MAG: arginine--tRNA ligase [Anaerolineaceae bacterium]|nr:arginine--tRNA ligase [Anaerolineaceae bacterium]